jgi:hypothetical protein
MNPHAAVYGTPSLYDLAFSYRDFVRECAFLCEVFERRRRRPLASFLELGAGPARHALELLETGVRATALDLAPEMAGYAAEKARARGLRLPYLVGDMCAFQVPERFDLAASMLCSTSYLLTDAAFLAHLESVSAALGDGGIYLLELPHPAEAALDGKPKTKSTWTMRDDSGELAVQWHEELVAGSNGKIRALVKMSYSPFNDGPVVLVEDVARLRRYSEADLRVLVAKSGRFDIAGIFGAFDEAVPVDADGAWRMLVVLNKRGGSTNAGG